MIMKNQILCSENQKKFPDFLASNLAGSVTLSRSKNMGSAGSAMGLPKLSNSCSVPPQLLLSDDLSDNKQSEYEERINELQSSNEQSRSMNICLVKELNESKNETRVSDALNSQLNIEKEKLRDEVKRVHEQRLSLQEQQISILQQTSRVKQENQILKARINNLEQTFVQCQLTEQTIMRDYHQKMQQNQCIRKQLAAAKNQFDTVCNQLRACEASQQIGRNRIRQLESMVASTAAYDQQLRKQVAEAKIVIDSIESQRNQAKQDNDALKDQLSKLHDKNQQLYSQLQCCEDSLLNQMRQFQELQLAEKSHCEQYTKTVEQLHHKNEEMMYELIALSKRNVQLVDERDHYAKSVTDKPLPEASYMIMIREMEAEIQGMKRELTIREQQIHELKSQWQADVDLFKEKEQSFQRIRRLTDNEHRQRLVGVQNETQALQFENSQLKSKLETLTVNAQNLREEVKIKDDLILKYVKK